MPRPVIFKDKFTLFPLLTGLVLLVAAFSVVYVRLADLQSLLVVHFDGFRGIDFLGSKSDVFGIVAAGLVIWCLNGFLVGRFYSRDRFLSYLLAFSSALFALLLLFAVIVIISIN